VVCGQVVSRLLVKVEFEHGIDSNVAVWTLGYGAKWPSLVSSLGDRGGHSVVISSVCSTGGTRYCGECLENFLTSEMSLNLLTRSAGRNNGYATKVRRLIYAQEPFSGITSDCSVSADIHCKHQHSNFFTR
jgi:hypothetical protein